jgi:hypothetical protein
LRNWTRIEGVVGEEEEEEEGKGGLSARKLLIYSLIANDPLYSYE